MRLQKVNEMLRRELSLIIQREFDFKDALVTISEVDVTCDFKEAKVFISVLGQTSTSPLIKIREKRGLIQSRLGKRITLKNTPVLNFRSDSSAEKGVEIVQLLETVDEIPKAVPTEEELNQSDDNL